MKTVKNNILNFIKFFYKHLNFLFPELISFFKNGFNVKRFLAYKDFWVNYLQYNSLNKDEKFKANISSSIPMTIEKYSQAGSINKHYSLQDLWAAKKVYESKVEKHYDIGSRVDGFIFHCLVFTKVVMLDIRPLEISVKNLEFIKTNAMNLSNIASNSISSISSLHAIEHFGLGRYGDPIDPEGYKKVINEIKRVVKRGGNVYISVPIGSQRVEFDAHRVFDPLTISELFCNDDQFRLIEFSYIDDNENLIINGEIKNARKCIFGCGLFHFRKIY